jgi:hypothetical protein
MFEFLVASGGQLILVVVLRERDHTWYEHAAVKVWNTHVLIATLV